MKKKRKKFTVLSIALCLFLCSCGANRTTEESVQTAIGQQTETDAQEREAQEEAAEKIYELDTIELPDADEALGGLLPDGGERFLLTEGLAGGKAYRMVEITQEAGKYDNPDRVNYYVQVLDAPYTEWVNYSVDMPDGVSTIDFWVIDGYITTDGTIKLLFQNHSSGSGYIGKWNEKDGFSATELPENIDLEVLDGTHLFRCWYHDEEEGLFLLNEETILRYDENGEKQQTALAKTGGLILKAVKNPYSGKLYFMGTSADTWESSTLRIYAGGFSVWTADSEKAVFTAQDCTGSDEDKANSSLTNSGDGENVAFASETEGYLGNQNGIYRFSMEDKSLKEVFSFESAGMGARTPSAVRRIWLSVGEGGELLIMYQCEDGTKGLARLAEQSAGADEGKQELELALSYSDSYLQKAVVDFNKQSDDYKIVLRLPSDTESLDDYRSRIQAELSAGSGPDIMERTVLDTATGAQKGYLLDLTEYYEACREILFPTVTQLGQAEGRYYGIPYKFNAQTMMADSTVVGERQGWSLAEMIQCVEESGVKTAIAQMDEAYSYYYMGARTENPELIDWEGGVSHLKEKQGCELLEFVTRYSDADSESGISSDRQVAEGESLTAVLFAMDPMMVLSVSQSMQGREIYTGFPTEDGSGGHCLTGSVMGVNRNSASTEGALEFLTYLLSEEQQSYQASLLLMDGSGGGDYPVREDVLTKLFEDFRTEAETKKEERELYGIPSLNAEQYDAIWEVLKNAKLYNNNTEIVLDLILEEAGAYRAGTKTAEQVMNIIDNRVQLYLDENR